MGLAFSLSAAEKNHHQKEYYSGTDVQCVSAFERPHCIMNDRLYSLGWRVILAVISYPSGLHDQAMGIDTVGSAGHQRKPILPVQDAQSIVQCVEIIFGDHGQNVCDLVRMNFPKDMQIDHVSLNGASTF